MNTELRPPPVGRRDQIIAAARDIVVREGVEALRMRRVAEAVDITAPAIYRHFADKDELVAGVIEGANELLGSYLRRSLTGENARERFDGSITALLEFALNERHDYELLFFMRSGMRRDRQPLTQRSPNFIFWVDRIRECIDMGDFRKDLDPVLSGVTVWAHMHGMVALHMQGRFDGDEQFRSVYKESLELVLAGLSGNATAS